MKLDALLVQTESWAQEELAAQTRYSELLEAQVEAVRNSSSDALLESIEQMDAEMEKRVGRERRRQALMKALAGEFGVDASTLTLTSIVERARLAGLNASRLEVARGKVRDAASRALRAGRRLATLVRYHQGVFQELLALITPREAGTQANESGGAWVHVEA